MKILWSVSAWRGCLEGCLVGMALLLITFSAMVEAPPLAISMFFFLTMVAAAGWAGLRVRLTAGPWKKVLITEGFHSLGMAAGLVVGVGAFLAVSGHLDLLQKSHVGQWGSIFFLGLGAPGYLGVRVFSYFWRFWDYLRRTRYVWGLTHTILCLIGAVGALALVTAIIYTAKVDQINLSEIPADSIFGRVVVWIFTFLLISLLAGFVGASIFTLPAVGFSYWVARRLTGRLDHLVETANALRQGNFSARVKVEGQDEVAAFQENFNNMAADLEKSTRTLQEERDKVARLLTLQRELTAGISHELRTPAATLTGYVDSLRQNLDQQTPQSIRHDLEIIAHEAGRLQNILNDLLTLSQSEADRLSLKLQPVAVEEVMRRAVDTLAPLAWKSKRVQVVADIKDGLPPAWGDALRVEQIILNLIQNGVRYTPPGGAVVASASLAEGGVLLEVADTGEGIRPEDLPHIWERFYRADNSEHVGEGVGLGLALVKELTEAMGGSVDVESAPGEGSVFRVRLPVCDTIATFLR